MHAAASRTTARVSAAVLGLSVALGLGACSTTPNGPDDPNAEASSNALGTTPDDDGFTPLPLYFVGLSGQYPTGVTGNQIGCSDLLVGVQSVPVETEEPVNESMRFLLNDEQYRHGDPALTNSVLLSSDNLTYQGYEVDGDTVEVQLSGSVVTRSACESYRVRAQLYATATAAAGVENARIMVDDVTLNDHLGLDPFERGEEVTVE